MVRAIALATGIAVLVLPALVYAEEYVVGDEEDWNSDVDYYAWSDGKKFYVGDILGSLTSNYCFFRRDDDYHRDGAYISVSPIFNYTQNEHNVIVVNATGYDKCLASPNLGAFDSGNGKITLTTPGNNFYICQWHCDFADQKLMISVLGKRMQAGTPESSPALPPYEAAKPFRKPSWRR